MSINLCNYCYFLYKTFGMREIEPKRFYEFKKYDELFKSMEFVSNYRFQFKLFEDANKIILVYLYGIVHYECFKKNANQRLFY